MALNSARLRASIENIEDLPTLPSVVTQISSQISNPSTNAADIGKLIECDQTLTSKVLRMVNSAYYGFPRQIKSIQHAVVILGFNKVKTIITTVSVFGIFPRRGGAAGLDVHAFWEHSLGVAIASKLSAEMLGIGHSAEDAFIGGLLHDIGKVIMDQFQPDVYAPVIQHALANGILLQQAEEEIIGVNHAHVGEWLMEKWRLPPALVRMVANHHSPARSFDRRELIGSVHLGDILARAMRFGNGGDLLMPTIDPVIATNHNINNKFLSAALDRFILEIGNAMDFFTLLTEES